MPRYFFHVYHDHAELDYEGEELPDKHARLAESNSNGRPDTARHRRQAQAGPGMADGK
jgi:hypothetical protein